MRRTYGLDDESVKDVTEARKLEIIDQVLKLYDKDGDRAVSRDEWYAGWVKEGKRLPDFGVSCEGLINRQPLHHKALEARG